MVKYGFVKCNIPDRDCNNIDGDNADSLGLRVSRNQSKAGTRCERHERLADAQFRRTSLSRLRKLDWPEQPKTYPRLIEMLGTCAILRLETMGQGGG